MFTSPPRCPRSLSRSFYCPIRASRTVYPSPTAAGLFTGLARAAAAPRGRHTAGHSERLQPRGGQQGRHGVQQGAASLAAPAGPPVPVAYRCTALLGAGTLRALRQPHQAVHARAALKDFVAVQRAAVPGASKRQRGGQQRPARARAGGGVLGRRGGGDWRCGACAGALAAAAVPHRRVCLPCACAACLAAGHAPGWPWHASGTCLKVSSCPAAGPTPVAGLE